MHGAAQEVGATGPSFDERPRGFRKGDSQYEGGKPGTATEINDAPRRGVSPRKCTNPMA